MRARYMMYVEVDDMDVAEMIAAMERMGLKLYNTGELILEKRTDIDSDYVMVDYVFDKLVVSASCRKKDGKWSCIIDIIVG